MRVFFTKPITVYRLQDASSKESYVLSHTIKGMIVPISAESAMLTDGNPAQSYKLAADYNSDIKKTDKLTYNGTDYIVTGIQSIDVFSLRRKEAILEVFNS
jgi:hypothetical protein